MIVAFDFGTCQRIDNWCGSIWSQQLCTSCLHWQQDCKRKCRQYYPNLGRVDRDWTVANGWPPWLGSFCHGLSAWRRAMWNDCCLWRWRQEHSFVGHVDRTANFKAGWSHSLNRSICQNLSHSHQMARHSSARVTMAHYDCGICQHDAATSHSQRTLRMGWFSCILKWRQATRQLGRRWMPYLDFVISHYSSISLALIPTPIILAVTVGVVLVTKQQFDDYIKFFW